MILERYFICSFCLAFSGKYGQILPILRAYWQSKKEGGREALHYGIRNGYSKIKFLTANGYLATFE